MARDYKNSGTRKKPKPLPGWAWLSTGLAIGLFVALLVYLDTHVPPLGDEPIRPSPSASTAAKHDGGQKASEDGAESEPRYDFYTILPEMEVVVPEGEVSSSGKDEDEKTATKPAEPGVYVLQAGSFRQAKQADRMRAKLALLGVEADIQTVTINGGETWHRVRIGPFERLDALQQVRSRLRENQIDVILLKVKG